MHREGVRAFFNVVSTSGRIFQASAQRVQMLESTRLIKVHYTLFIPILEKCHGVIFRSANKSVRQPSPLLDSAFPHQSHSCLPSN
jgi:hypothetical protein